MSILYKRFRERRGMHAEGMHSKLLNKRYALRLAFDTPFTNCDALATCAEV